MRDFYLKLDNQNKKEFRLGFGFISIFLFFFILTPFLFPGPKSEIIKKIKSSMNDPDSFKLRDFKKSYSTTCNDTYLVTFSGKNGFGGVVSQTYYVIYKNDNYCIMGDWGSGGGSVGWSDDDFMKGMISSNGCSC